MTFILGLMLGACAMLAWLNRSTIAEWLKTIRNGEDS